MRLLGIDYGRKRVGVALSDESGAMAFPRVVLKNDQALLDKIETLVVSERVTEIIIGHSKNLDGTPNPIHEAVETFIGDLTLRLGIPVHLEPEQFSTQEATRFQGRNDETDASAAAIILNSFITRRHGTHE